MAEILQQANSRIGSGTSITLRLDAGEPGLGWAQIPKFPRCHAIENFAPGRGPGLRLRFHIPRSSEAMQ